MKDTSGAMNETPKRRPYQYSLRSLFVLTSLVAFGMSVLRSADFETVVFALATILLFGIACITFRDASAQRIGIFTGACAGFLITAIHGRALPVEVYNEGPGLMCVLSSAIIFGAGGLVVTTFATNISDKVRFVSHWVLAGFIVGPAIKHIAVLIASTNPNGFFPIIDASRLFTANLFAVFLGATMGGLLGTDAITNHEASGDKTGR